MSQLLKVENLTVAFEEAKGERILVDQISFSVNKGEVVCLVGESGCGKSLTALSMMGLLEKNGKVTGGSVFLEGIDLLSLSEKEKDNIRGNQMTMIFQDPLSSLNPVFTVGSQIAESLHAHMKLSKEETKSRVCSLLEKVGLRNPERVRKQYPHTFSGGMRQRVMIAMALACQPKLLIADEPTTALDVTIQAQIMNLLQNMQKENGMGMLFITHDIGLVAQMADRVLVMYAGQIVEEAEVGELFQNPKHPYTKALLATVPSIYDKEDRVLEAIPGMVPENYGELQGCRFAGRCKYRCEQCETAQEDYVFASGHTAKCVVMKEREKKYGEK